MRVALIVPGFSATDSDWAIPALLNLARELASSAEIHIFSQRYPTKGRYQLEGLTHHALGGGQRYGLRSAQIWLQTSRTLVDQHRRTPFDLLHAFWADEAGFSATLAGKAIGRPVIVSLGGGELTRLPQVGYGAQRFLVRRLTTRWALRWATLITAGSGYQLALCRDHGLAPGRLQLAPLGVDTSLFQAKDPATGQASPDARPVQGQAPILVQAASLQPVKNQALLLEVLRLAKPGIPGLRLKLAGSGPLAQELRRLAEDMGLVEAIDWLGHVPYPQMPQVYQSAQLYLQTSRHESQGMAVLEAMACGVPVIGTPVGVLPDVACLPASAVAEVLAGQVVHILTENAVREACSRQAREIASARYSLPASADRFLELYTTALVQRTGADGR